MKINDKIRTLREINNLTQEEMAGQLHMSTNGYANIERGDTKVNTDKLEKIAEIFNMTIIELMNFGEKNSVLCIVGENTIHNGVNVIGSTNGTELIHEITKLQLIIEHQNKEMSQLKEIISLLKNQK